MKKTTKGFFVGLLLGTSITAQALSFSQDSIDRYKDFDWKGASYEDLQGAFSAYQGYLSSSVTLDEYRLKEKWLVKFLLRAYPNMANYWNDAYVFESMRVIHADSLINLERNKIDKAVMGARMHPSSAQHSPRISDGADYPELKTSLVRMKSGLAPIGPDNSPMLLCKLNDDPRASYFEVTERESWKILNVLMSGMSKDQACLGESVIPYYWKDRAKNLFNVRKNIVKSKRDHLN